MRMVESREQFADALEAAKREAKAAFGDDRVLLERYIERPRHVEVQILGDQHGHLVYLGERECSIQRRNQKLIEESPSPAVDAQLRAAMGDAAIRLAQAAAYSNAGTVEFLLDQAGVFAFLEVNARLQVEHPVTEAVTGLDLVELQLRIAAGEALPFTQEQVKVHGHAIEARVVAEDVLAGWVPSTGVLERFDPPYFERTDSGVRMGATVSPYYDSLLAKVIAHSETRTAAIGRMSKALRQMVIEGVQHNVDLLLSTIEHPAFVRGDLHTGFLEEHRIVDDLASVPPEVLAAASALEFMVTDRGDPWRGPVAWRVGRVDQPAAWIRAGRVHEARVWAEPGGSAWQVTIGDGAHTVRVPAGDGWSQRLEVDGRRVTFEDGGPERW